MIRPTPLAAAFTFALGLSIGAPAPVAAQDPALTYEMAERAADAAEAEARRNGWNVTILVADADGVPVYVKRLTGASPRSFEVAMRKARTAAATGLTTAEYGQRREAGRIAELEDGVTFAGGVPILAGGQVIGAIGTSGVRADDDEVVSRAGVEAIE
ncbi:MAG TPA: heme-binding protein [Longimicrobiaceae bacterium]|nr:heme-binding protein [Longimicrobiaceae bacterium]